MYLTKMKTSQNALETQREITQHYVDYVDRNMRMELTNYDELIAKEINSFLLSWQLKF